MKQQFKSKGWQGLALGLLLLLSMSICFSGCLGDKAVSLAEEDQPILPPPQKPPEEPLVNLDVSGRVLPVGLPPGQMYAGEVPLQDVDESPYVEAIRNLYQNSMIPAYDNNYFYPDRALTRGEALLWIYNVLMTNAENEKREKGDYYSYHPLRAPEEGYPEEPSSLPLGHYFQPLATMIKASGRMAAYEDLLNEPDQQVTRAELATMVTAFSVHDEMNNGDGDEKHRWLLRRLEKHRIADGVIVRERYLEGVVRLVTMQNGQVFEKVFPPPSRELTDPDMSEEETPSQLKFEPDKPVTRAEGAELLELLKNDLGKAFPYKPKIDVPE